MADSFGVTAVAGTVMHQMKRFVIDASKVILLREDADKKVDTCTFEAGEVYAVDVCFTTGEGKPREEVSSHIHMMVREMTVLEMTTVS